MEKQQKGLSNFQISTLVTMNIIGLTVMFIPMQAASNAGVDGVFSALIAGFISIFMTGIIIILGKRFPQQSVIEYSRRILGKYLGWAYGALLVLHALFVTAYVLRGFADVMKVLLLPKTPLEIIMISMLLLSVYCVHGGISTIVRVCEIFLLPVILVIGATIVFNLSAVELYRFRSSFANGIKPIAAGAFRMMFAYFGYEVLLFTLPFMKNRDQAMRSSTVGLILPILLYTGLVFVAIGVFGVRSTTELVYPTIQLARRFGVTFFERFDIFFIVIWIMAIFTTITIYLYMSSFAITRLFRLLNYKPFVFILTPACYAIAILPQNVIHINMIGMIMNYSGIFIVFSSLPLLILAIIRKKGGRNNG